MELEPYQQKAYDALMKHLRKTGVSPTGRDLDEVELRRATNKMFVALHDMPRVHDSIHYMPLEMNFEDLERRMIANTPMSNIDRAKLVDRMIFSELYGMTYICDTYKHMEPGIDYVPPVQDFAKAKTGREQLQARLAPKKLKSKPSGLLSKLVGKK
jgi:hypothetical protein